MKKSSILLPLIALVVVGLFATSVNAMDMMKMSHPQPGPDFGRHVAMMSPGHSDMHQGAEFGHMVSNMAQGNSCH